jgi:hypothetical protein
MCSYGGLDRIKEKEVMTYFESTDVACTWMDYRKPVKILRMFSS